MIRSLIALMRPKHYLKNGLIFVPLAFSGSIFKSGLFLETFMAVIIFSLIASVIYIINDIQDVDKDRLHPQKKNRPLASGELSISMAWGLVVFLVLLITIITALASLPLVAVTLLALYFVINIAYSLGLKHVPIMDVAVLSSGFVIRVIYGASVVDVDISRWLYLTVLAAAFYVSLGKRRNEIIANGTRSRRVNKYYTLNFLDKNMYVSMALTLVFYSLWATDPQQSAASLFWTIPIVMLIFMTYSLHIEKDDSTGDPVEVLLGDKVLMALVLVYACLTSYLLLL